MRRLRDREQLLKTLRDYDAGKGNHLTEREKEHFVASVKKRIADLNETIARLESET
ncbi:MAG TPA: hypothetical protein VFK79_02350 [Xanthobacteraceae bacterium]|nr:hypothetical protein [Xanthobacteraceae bacterium]